MPYTSYDQQPGIELKWDIPALLRNVLNGNVAVFGATARLQPTALNGCVAGMSCPNGIIPYVFGAFITSDTNIEWTFYNTNGATLAALQYTPIGPANLPSQCPWGGQVGSIPAVRQIIDGGFAGAYQRVNVLDKGWVTTVGSTGLVIATTAVAANVYITMYWAEFEYR